jgi:hypothetical protein
MRPAAPIVRPSWDEVRAQCWNGTITNGDGLSERRGDQTHPLCFGRGLDRSSAVLVSRAFAATAACRRIFAFRIPLLGLEVMVEEVSRVEARAVALVSGVHDSARRRHWPTHFLKIAV